MVNPRAVVPETCCCIPSTPGQHLPLQLWIVLDFLDLFFFFKIWFYIKIVCVFAHLSVRAGFYYKTTEEKCPLIDSNGVSITACCVPPGSFAPFTHRTVHIPIHHVAWNIDATLHLRPERRTSQWDKGASVFPARLSWRGKSHMCTCAGRARRQLQPVALLVSPSYLSQAPPTAPAPPALQRPPGQSSAGMRAPCQCCHEPSLAARFVLLIRKADGMLISTMWGAQPPKRRKAAGGTVLFYCFPNEKGW